MTIFIFALHGVATGGPEATHQLSDALIEQGFDARLIYFRWEDLREGPLREFPEYSAFAPEYERYKTSLARQAIDEEGHVIVLPETLAHAVPFFQKAKVLVWWLSVDNAFGALSAINLNYLRRPNVYHASQSRYAEKFCEALQLNHVGMLSDYTVDLKEYADPLPMSERPKIVAFNARPDKVIADLDAIVQEIKEIDPEIECIGIHGLKRNQIAAVFAQARVYVDLGNFPGKDRLPREAASMGCVPICLSVGAGAECSWQHTTIDCLHDPRLIVGAVNDPEMMRFGNWVAQYLTEQDTFNTEVRDVFSQLA